MCFSTNCTEPKNGAASGRSLFFGCHGAPSWRRECRYETWNSSQKIVWCQWGVFEIRGRYLWILGLAYNYNLYACLANVQMHQRWAWCRWAHHQACKNWYVQKNHPYSLWSSQNMMFVSPCLTNWIVSLSCRLLTSSFLSAKLPIVRQSSNSYFRVSSHCDPYLSITNYFKLKDGILGLSK